MAVMEVLMYGHPFLRKQIREVTAFDERVSELAENMIETMSFHEGVGLAAPQVGTDQRLIVIDAGASSENRVCQPLVLINPNILSAKGQNVFREGCLSLPDIFADVKRPETVTVQFQDPRGRTYVSIYSGVEARIIQHELDHLNGILFIDHLNPLNRWMLRSRLNNLKRRSGDIKRNQNEKSLTEQDGMA